MTDDWAAELSETLFSIAAAVDSLDGPAWNAESTRPGTTVADVVTGAIDRLERRRLFSRGSRRPPETLAREDAVELLRELSARDGRRTVRELAIGVVCAYNVAGSTGLTITVDPSAARAVALTGAAEDSQPVTP